MIKDETREVEFFSSLGDKTKNSWNLKKNEASMRFF